MSSPTKPAKRSLRSRDRHHGSDIQVQSEERIDTPSTQPKNQPRKRGRRPKANKPETPSEKRRTQIRMAQRAYRARQEETLSQVKGRICELEDVVEHLSQTFLTFSDRLLQSGMLENFPKLAQSLQNTTEQFIRLANEATGSTENDSPTASNESPPSMTISASTQESSDSWTLTNPTPSKPNNDLLDRDLIGVRNVFVHTPKRQRLNDDSPNNPPFCTIPDDLFSRDLSLLDTLPSPTLQSKLRPPMSSLYGPRSPLFGERLHWVCTNRAYRLLKDPTIPDWKLSRAFGFLLGIMTRDQITAYFGLALKHSWAPHIAGMWDVPMLKIGGAGSHYPKKRLQSSDNNKTNVFSLSIIEDQASTYRRSSGFGDFEEVWFDATDVEGFLEENGIILVNETLIRELSGRVSLGRMEVGEVKAILRAHLGRPHPRPARGALLAIEESKLVDWLSAHGFCLGRMAGFRKVDLESFIFQYAWPIE